MTGHETTMQDERRTTTGSRRTAGWTAFAAIAAMIGGGWFPILVSAERAYRPTSAALGPLADRAFVVLVAAATCCLALGTIGFYARLRGTYRPIGIGGAILAGLGFASMAVTTVLGGATPQAIAPLLGLGPLGAALGSAVLGLALRRTDTGSRLAAGLLVVGSPLFVFALDPAGSAVLAVPFGLGWALAGHDLVLERQGLSLRPVPGPALETTPTPPRIRIG